MHLKLKYNDINKINILFAAAMSFYIVLLGVNSLFNTFAYGTSIDSIAVFGLYSIIIILAIIPVINNVNVTHRILFFGFIIIGIVGSIQNTENTGRIFSSIIKFSSFFLVGAAIQNNSCLEHYISISVVIATIFGGFYVSFSLMVPGQYLHDMTAAYSLLPSAIMAVYYALSRRSILYYIVWIASLFEILVMGVRGPILIYIIAMTIVVFRNMSKWYQKALLLLFVIFILYYIVSERYIVLLCNIDDYLSSFGMKNSIVKSLIQKSFFDDDGRTVINEIVQREINASPAFGHGVFYDRLILNGGYTHNILTELLIDFGYIFGISGFIAILWRTIILIYKSKDNQFQFCLVIMIIALSLGQNMVSGSYLENEFFFLLLGVSFNHKLWSKETKETYVNISEKGVI